MNFVQIRKGLTDSIVRGQRYKNKHLAYRDLAIGLSIASIFPSCDCSEARVVHFWLTGEYAARFQLWNGSRAVLIAEALSRSL